MRLGIQALGAVTGHAAIVELLERWEPPREDPEFQPLPTPSTEEALAAVLDQSAPRKRVTPRPLGRQ